MHLREAIDFRWVDQLGAVLEVALEGRDGRVRSAGARRRPARAAPARQAAGAGR